MKKEKIDSALKNTKGIERNLLAKRFLEKITYTPDKIKISLILSQNPMDFEETKNPAPQLRGGKKCLPENFSANRRENKNPFFSENDEFVLSNLAPNKKSEQTFTITLPNLIHKSKKRNLK